MDINWLKVSGAPGKTSTKVFIAINVLNSDSYMFMHNLESFFLMIFWICVHYTEISKKSQNVGNFKNWNYMSTNNFATFKIGLVLLIRFKKKA